MTGQDQARAVRLLPGNARRILLHGVTGSGKSSLARKLGAITGINVHLVDDEFGWLADWTPRPPEEMRSMVAVAAAESAWIFDAAYSTFRDLVLPRTELIIGLDYSRTRTLCQLIRRTVQRINEKEPVCNGNIETWRGILSKDSILIWHFQSFSRNRATIRKLAAAAAANATAPRVIVFKNPSQCAEWLRLLDAAAPESDNR